MEEAPAGARRAKIEHGDELTGGKPRQRAGGAADPHVRHRRYFTDEFEMGRKVRELERDAQGALHDLFAGHDQPQQRRERNRHELQAR